MARDQSALTRGGAVRDPFALFRQMSSDIDRMFDGSRWPALRVPFLRARTDGDAPDWSPGIDVFEKNGRLVTRVDLPGMKKEDVKVEVTDGHLTIAGERKGQQEEKEENYYRCEREYGSFYRTVPLPASVKLEDVQATFGDGVLEVSVPLPAQPASKVRRIEIQETER